MTFRSSDRAREKALAELTREAADAPMPELDWDRMESRILAATEIEPASPTASRSAIKERVRRVPTFASTPWSIAVAAAAAAMLIYGTTAMRAPSTSRDVHAQLTSPEPPIAGFTSLSVGEVVETGTSGVVYDRPGPVRLTLAPNSRASVVANDYREGPRGGISVALERGSIHAAVTQKSDGEIFAVEVEKTRIAAHGTAFRVTREADRVVVDITEGAVAIGPIGHRHATHGWLLSAPARAAFSLDGARQATWLEAAPPVAIAAAEEPASEPPSPVAVSSSTRAKRVATASPPRSEPPVVSKNDNTTSGAPVHGSTWGEGANVDGSDPIEQEAAATAAILRKLAACYEKQVSADSVRFSVESSLSLTLAPNGAIREGVFTPPLSPTLMNCADKAVGEAHFPGGDSVREVRIPVRLGR